MYMPVGILGPVAIIFVQTVWYASILSAPTLATFEKCTSRKNKKNLCRLHYVPQSISQLLRGLRIIQDKNFIHNIAARHASLAKFLVIACYILVVASSCAFFVVALSKKDSYAACFYQICSHFFMKVWAVFNLFGVFSNLWILRSLSVSSILSLNSFIIIIRCLVSTCSVINHVFVARTLVVFTQLESLQIFACPVLSCYELCDSWWVLSCAIA